MQCLKLLYPHFHLYMILSSVQCFQASISELNPFKSPGPDAVSGHVLKQVATEVTLMLTHLFQQSLSIGEVPKQWKLVLSPQFLM